MSIQPNISTSVRPQLSSTPRPAQVTDTQVHGTEVNQRHLPSALEQSVRSVVSRLDGLNARLDEVSVAAKAVSSSTVAAPADSLGDGFKARHADGIKTQQAVQGLLEKLEASKVPAHRVEAELRKLAALEASSAPEFKQSNLSFADKAGKQLRGLQGAPQSIQSGQGQANGNAEFFQQLTDMIGFIKDDYLSVYESLLTKYSDFYKEFNETIMAKMGGWIEGKEDGKKVEVNSGLRNALQTLLSKYQKAPDGVLYPTDGWTCTTKENAEKWAKAMGLPDTCVRVLADGSCRVMMDLSPLQAMVSAAPSGTTTWDSAKFQAWQTGFNSQEGDLKNQLQLFTTKYGSANSYHENFNKILSSQLSQYAEMLKAIASGIA
ncbi:MULTISPECIES: IpaD/SipD/SspD family type III secretion system needle tip protein [Pseudomonas]|uniref:IpaD/SipD/SspD family type III secretion system needle tip protein n=1 Tax=Pseudomonas TaxID=286 RepID=UPI000B364363|nr:MULTISPECIES: IpaD/SipD/SspD family type III secretion system needle tip protein [Pseudomonas]PMY64799.1 type III secretion system needle tip protein SipD [Pseudomonas sp. FW305-25]PMY69280.1 type III secretion system needle tip protein SipD [Pseudomonas sp. FW126-L8]PNA80031.1 type III secretion system needle tip protein SipD [Pseudomonas sp. FW305-76]